MPAAGKHGFLLALSTPTLPWQGLWLGSTLGQPDLFAWFSLAVVFGLIPVLDWLVGHDPHNPSEEQARVIGRDPFFRILVLAAVPVQLASVVAGAWVFSTWPFAVAGQIGWTVSIGVVSGIVGIVSAHELIHRQSALDRVAGGVLLGTVCYGTFKVEHVRGHHADVGTPEDATTARFGQSFYAYLVQILPANFFKAWRLECARLATEGQHTLSLRNELIWWTTLSLALAAGLVAAFGPRAPAFFLCQSLVAIALLEVIDYIEHYGLVRHRLADGSYEPVSARHAWNSDFLLSNLFLFNLQRHPDHHLYSRRPYQILRHIGRSPQLPAGYATMVMIALIPPLWFAVMNPRVAALHDGVTSG